MIFSKKIEISKDVNIFFLKKYIHLYTSDEQFAAKVMTILKELSSNIIKYTPGGEIIFSYFENSDAAFFDILALDRGNGIKKIFFEDKYTTGKSLGIGLGAVKRLSDEIDYYNTPTGSVILSRIYKKKQKSKFEIGGLNIPKEKEQVSGDIWDYVLQDNKLNYFHFDATGHGLLAFETAKLALLNFRKNYKQTHNEIIKKLNFELNSNRGGAGMSVKIDLINKILTYTAVGNIRAVLYNGSEQKRFIFYNGIIGYNLPNFGVNEFQLKGKGILAVFSDGFRSSFDIEKYPGLKIKHPALIAGVLYKMYGRNNDDFSLTIIKFNK